MIVHSLPFSFVEWPETHALLHLSNPLISIPQSHNTIRTAALEQWGNLKADLRAFLHTAISPIHIALDIWTSPNNLLFLGVVAHFVREDKQQKSKALLGLKEIGSHDGAQQWEILRPILQEFKIVRNIGCIMGDSSGTNDTLARSISKWYEDENLPSWSAERNRCRCMGHILNLIVQAFFKKDL
jgi:hypothetical protein